MPRLSWFSLQMMQPWIDAFRDLSLEDIRVLLDRYSDWGPLPGILFPMLEALLPFLPLVVFVVANANAYGMWPGFLYSWIGVILGASTVFWLVRRLGGRAGNWLRRRYPQTEKFFAWVERKGFTPVFLLSCFPFTPSIVVNIASGLSNMAFRTFFTAILLGKAVMIFAMSFLGHDLEALLRKPWRLALAAAVLAAFWLVGKKLEARYTK